MNSQAEQAAQPPEPVTVPIRTRPGLWTQWRRGVALIFFGFFYSLLYSLILVLALALPYGLMVEYAQAGKTEASVAWGAVYFVGATALYPLVTYWLFRQLKERFKHWVD